MDIQEKIQHLREWKKFLTSSKLCQNGVRVHEIQSNDRDRAAEACVSFAWLLFKKDCDQLGYHRIEEHLELSLQILDLLPEIFGPANEAERLLELRWECSVVLVLRHSHSFPYKELAKFYVRKAEASLGRFPSTEPSLCIQRHLPAFGDAECVLQRDTGRNAEDREQDTAIADFFEESRIR